jgi:PleD family two-component response regulator
VITLPIVGTVGPGAAGEPPPATDDAPGQVLVVVDEPEIRRMLDELLAAEGHVVEQAANGREALERSATSPSIW